MFLVILFSRIETEPKPIATAVKNVFSNDGSFLDQFRLLKDKIVEPAKVLDDSNEIIKDELVVNTEDEGVKNEVKPFEKSAGQLKVEDVKKPGSNNDKVIKMGDTIDENTPDKKYK